MYETHYFDSKCLQALEVYTNVYMYILNTQGNTYIASSIPVLSVS